MFNCELSCCCLASYENVVNDVNCFHSLFFILLLLPFLLLSIFSSMEMLTSNSTYFSTSEPKAKLMTRYSREMTLINSDSSDLTKKKVKFRIIFFRRRSLLFKLKCAWNRNEWHKKFIVPWNLTPLKSFFLLYEKIYKIIWGTWMFLCSSL